MTPAQGLTVGGLFMMCSGRRAGMQNCRSNDLLSRAIGHCKDDAIGEDSLLTSLVTFRSSKLNCIGQTDDLQRGIPSDAVSFTSTPTTLREAVCR